MKFENFTWKNLPYKARIAVETLKMDEKSWKVGWSKIDEYWWEELSSPQRDAAIKLGWDQSAWDNNYDDSDWTDLPSHVITAASSLGFTQDTWDSDKWPAVHDKEWRKMTKEEHCMYWDITNTDGTRWYCTNLWRRNQAMMYV